MTGPEDNPRDDVEIDRNEYERWQERQKEPTEKVNPRHPQEGSTSRGKPKPRFKIGQVVHVGFALSSDAYGVILGFDDDRWHVQIREYEHKINEQRLRALNRTEKGKT